MRGQDGGKVRGAGDRRPRGQGSGVDGVLGLVRPPDHRHCLYRVAGTLLHSSGRVLC